MKSLNTGSGLSVRWAPSPHLDPSPLAPKLCVGHAEMTLAISTYHPYFFQSVFVFGNHTSKNSLCFARCLCWECRCNSPLCHNHYNSEVNVNHWFPEGLKGNTIRCFSETSWRKANLLPITLGQIINRSKNQRLLVF